MAAPRPHVLEAHAQRQVDIRETPRQAHCTKGMTKTVQPWDGKTMHFGVRPLGFDP